MKKNKLTEQDVQMFEKLNAQMMALHQEASQLSKKSPDSPINKLKLKFINEKLSKCNIILLPPHKPFDEFDLFDEEALPSNSDIVMVLSQYISCLEGWRSANVKRDGYTWYWATTDGSQIESEAPTRFTTD